MRGVGRLAVLGLLAWALAGCTTIGGPAANGSSSAGIFSPSPVPGANQGLLEPLGGGLVARSGADRLSRADRLVALQSEYRALEYTAPGDRVTWQARNGLAGEIVPSQPYRVGSQDCRQYSHTLTQAGGVPVVVRGTACRNPDGSWTLLS